MRIDYDILQGDTLVIDIQPLDDDDAPVPLAGYTVTVAVEYVNASGARASWSGSIGSGVVIGDDSIITCAIPASVTEQMRADRRADWQMRLTDALGAVQTLAAGRIRVQNSSFV